MSRHFSVSFSRCPIQQQIHIFYSVFLLFSCLSPQSTPGGLWLYKSHAWTIQQCLCAPSVPPLPALTSFIFALLLYLRLTRIFLFIHPGLLSTFMISFISEWVVLDIGGGDPGKPVRSISTIEENQWEAPRRRQKQRAQSNRQQLLWTQSNFQDHPLLHCRNWGGLSISCSKNKGHWD